MQSQSDQVLIVDDDAALRDIQMSTEIENCVSLSYKKLKSGRTMGTNSVYYNNGITYNSSVSVIVLQLETVYFLSLLVACVYSRAIGNYRNGWKPGHKKARYHTDLPWDHPIPRKRAHSHPVPDTDECCPSVTQIIQPVGGVSKHGRVLELYQDLNATQSFYQTSCKEGVKGRHCKYLDHESRSRSMCVQRYTYTYALVKEAYSAQSWRLDYIRVRSGCYCEIKVRNHQDIYEKKRKRLEGSI